MLYFYGMKYPTGLTNLFYKALHFYNKCTGIAKRKVLIKSMRTSVEYNGEKFPQREFYALSRRNKEMASGKVRVGFFQELKYQYCVFSGVFVKSQYRRRHLAEKLVKARLMFCEREKFETVLAFIEPHNKASITLHEKCGFTFLKQETWTSWMKSELERFQKDLIIGVYHIKKPAQ